MPKKYKRPTRKKGQTQTHPEQSDAGVNVEESRADVEEFKEETKVTEQIQRHEPTQPKKRLCGAQKKKLKKAKLEKARHALSLFNLPRELLQNILHLTYNEEATRGLSQDMKDEYQCRFFAPLTDQLRRFALSKAQDALKERDLILEDARKKWPRTCEVCLYTYIWLIKRDKGKLTDWLIVLKLIHPGLLDDAKFVAEKLAKEFWHTLRTEQFQVTKSDDG
ncbi:hypothetical protein EG327_000343 [Venturia inaequalis]|uniref:Uncharacterized protein n=1 Tax=Venturia inaequalis TaxID=5025 RepID=A0A8H3VNM5_VENIN|nr:hypothetical protein EG327_000343 [Venturia inaequalis]